MLRCRSYHPIILPVSAAQKLPLLARLRLSISPIILVALSSGVIVLAVSLSSGTPLVFLRFLNMSVFTWGE